VKRARNVHAWTERYLITSVAGNVYTYRMLADLAMRLAREGLAVHLQRKYVHDVLDDHAFMRKHRGETPAAVARDVVFEAWNRDYNDVMEGDY
jgi:hypothetical protein